MALILTFIGLFLDSKKVHAESFRIKNPNCRIQVYKNKKWESQSGLPFSAGTVVKTKPIPGRMNQRYVWIGNAYAATPISCLENNDNDPVAPPQIAPQITETSGSGPDSSSLEDSTDQSKMVSKKSISIKKKSYYWGMSYFSWAEQIRLDEGSGVVSLLNANQVAFSLGIGSRFRMSSRSQLDLGLNAFISSSQVGPSSKALLEASADYQSRNSGTFGAIFRPTVYFFPTSEKLAFGFSIPLMYRKANWPIPVEGARFVESSALRYGLQLDSKLFKDQWALGNRIGFIQNLLGFAWDINVSRNF